MANKKFSDLPAAGALDGTELMAVSQAASSKKSLLSAIKTFILGALSGFTVSTSATLTENSDTVLATQKAVKAYVDALLATSDAMVYKGATDCAGNPNYPAANAGDTYRVSVAGKIGGASGKVVEVGDWFVCNLDATAAGAEAAVGTKWNVIQTNLDGAVIGPASATDSHLAVFDGASGKLLKDGGAAPVSSIAGASTWAARPAASAYPKGTIWYVNDIGSAGTYWKTDGATRWYPLGGTVNLFALAAPGTGLCTAETILGQFQLPIGLPQVGDTLRLWNAWGKTGTTNSMISRIRIGTAGTVADTSVIGATMFTTAQRSAGVLDDLTLLTATSIQKKGVAGLYSYSPTPAAAVPDVAVAISSAAANALWVSATALSNGSTDTISLEDFRVQIIAKP